VRKNPDFQIFESRDFYFKCLDKIGKTRYNIIGKTRFNIINISLKEKFYGYVDHHKEYCL